jgi:large subunit ribosomal protein L17
MRHNKKVNHLGRQSAHRKALMANMATSLIMHKRISTTVAKAKALRGYVEPLVTRSKEDTTHSRRICFSYLRDKMAVTELFRVVAPAVGDRPGGYTRILKTGFRQGDASDMCIIELVDFNETYGKEAQAAGKARTRRGRSGAAKAAPAAEGAEASQDAAAPAAEKKPAAKKAAPKKPAAPKPTVNKAAQKTSGSKVGATRVSSKKGA